MLKNRKSLVVNGLNRRSCAWSKLYWKISFWWKTTFSARVSMYLYIIISSSSDLLRRQKKTLRSLSQGKLFAWGTCSAGCKYALQQSVTIFVKNVNNIIFSLSKKNSVVRARKPIELAYIILIYINFSFAYSVTEVSKPMWKAKAMKARLRLKNFSRLIDHFLSSIIFLSSLIFIDLFRFHTISLALNRC